MALLLPPENRAASVSASSARLFSPVHSYACPSSSYPIQNSQSVRTARRACSTAARYSRPGTRLVPTARDSSAPMARAHAYGAWLTPLRYACRIARARAPAIDTPPRCWDRPIARRRAVSAAVQSQSSNQFDVPDDHLLLCEVRICPTACAAASRAIPREIVLRAPRERSFVTIPCHGISHSTTRVARCNQSVSASTSVPSASVGSQRRIVDVPFLSSTVKGVRIRHVEGCADLQPLRQVRVSQERFAE